MKNANHELTTIQIRKETRKTLKHLARKDQNYDDLLIELINNNGHGLARSTNPESTTRPEPQAIIVNGK